MAHGDYYNPANKSVTDGTVVYADDINKINTAIDSALEQVAYDLDVIEAGLEAGGLSAKNWATEDQGTRPDPILDLYSAKAYALEAKDWASAAGTITEASTGTALAGSASAKTKAAEAAASALAASGSASSASGSASIATTKAGEALNSANAAALSETNAGNSAIAAAASAANLPNATTAGANKLITTNSSGSGWEYPSITTAGKAILDDASASEQRTTLGLGNVANVDTTNASNITSGILADARIASTIARDSELAAHTNSVNNPHVVTKAQVGLGNVDNTSDANKPVSTATQTALNLKANLESPVFTGNPTSPTQAYALGAADSSVKIANTAYVNNRIAELTKFIMGTAFLQMLPSGLLLQIGREVASSTAGEEVSVLFPSSYSNDNVFVLVSGITSNTAANQCWVTYADRMGFKFRASLALQSVTWLAFGYSSLGDDV